MELMQWTEAIAIDDKPEELGHRPAARYEWTTHIVEVESGRPKDNKTRCGKALPEGFNPATHLKHFFSPAEIKCQGCRGDV